MQESPPSTPDTTVGRLVERWLPGGARSVAGVRSIADKHRLGVLVAIVLVIAAIVTAVVLSNQHSVVESAPSLPAAISAAPVESVVESTTSAAVSLVVSVVGRVLHPGLVTLPSGSRVADALQAAGGVLPGTNDIALNLARRLADGEQIYVGIPVPAGAAQPEQDAPVSDDPSAGAAAVVDINTADEAELETLPGIGPTMAQRILAWRTQHGHFDSISQLRDIQGIGPGRYAKIEKLVTT